MKTYKTVQGDTWDLIARKAAGSEYAMTALIEANPDKAKTRIFKGGVILNIPETETAAVKLTPPWGEI